MELVGVDAAGGAYGRKCTPGALRKSQVRLGKFSSTGKIWNLPGRPGTLLVGTVRAQDRWHEAVVDVTWVCEHIVKSGGLAVPATDLVKSAAPRTAANKRK